MEEKVSETVLPAWHGHVQTLHSYFGDTTCIVWINPAQGDPFEQDDLVAARKVIVPIAHPRFDLRYAPYLVELDLSRYQDGDVLARAVELAVNAWTLDSLQRMNGHAVCGWVAAPCAAHELARYWARTCHVHHHNGLDKLLRFHDPGVREWLWAGLDSRQRAVLLGPARSILAISRHEDLLEHTAMERPPSLENPGLGLSARQWAELEDYAVVHAAWCALCVQDETWRMRFVNQPDWPKEILECLRHATRYDVTDPQDRVLFARHAMEIGADFHLNAALLPVWAQTRRGEFYGGALEATIGASPDRLLDHLQHKD